MIERLVRKFRAANFEQPDQVIQLGVAPNRIDILTGLTALNFDDVCGRRGEVVLEGIQLAVHDRQSFRRNKEAPGRAKDLADIEGLV
ncbi:MAG: hypothetical protein FGM15_09185 [Chthoniobacterales bacterium]|nr:hypothetical protein [Chthoniobacterales bacterium]